MTVVAVDVAPSAGPGADTEPVARVGSESARVATKVLERYGARVERFLGDKLIGSLVSLWPTKTTLLRAVGALPDVRTAVHWLDSGPSTSEAIGDRSSAGLETGDIIVAGPGVPLPMLLGGRSSPPPDAFSTTGVSAGAKALGASPRLVIGEAICGPSEPIQGSDLRCHSIVLDQDIQSHELRSSTELRHVAARVN